MTSPAVCNAKRCVRYLPKQARYHISCLSYASCHRQTRVYRSISCTRHVSMIFIYTCQVMQRLALPLHNVNIERSWALHVSMHIIHSYLCNRVTITCAIYKCFECIHKVRKCFLLFLVQLVCCERNSLEAFTIT